ncbi:MAG: hypothetical protein A3E78_12405 [Alphaproteobacteria bacterium RIFCSPHIGHO2_12_FULL_63_12]|nr:MAG: hypothetical protein A3E78_12405 [Alphaproteobacteria bacterium RIFCSPHIGHO2_12_FULL_63_12]
MGNSLLKRVPFPYFRSKRARMGRLAEYLERFAAPVERFGPQIFVTSGFCRRRLTNSGVRRNQEPEAGVM